jgi:hypothetical protein
MDSPSRSFVSRFKDIFEHKTVFLIMTHGRQLRLFLANGTSSGPRFYEIVNRTIQAIVIPSTRIAEAMSEDWREFQKPGVYLVHGATEDGGERLYIGKGEDVAKRVQSHPDKLDFDIMSLLLVTSKDENLNGSQVGWLESSLITAAKDAKKVGLANIQHPEEPLLGKPELATVSEFIDDLILIAQTAGFDFFTPPKEKVKRAPQEAKSRLTTEGQSPEFTLTQPTKGIAAKGFLSDEGFVVKAGSDAAALPNDSFRGTYLDLRATLIEKGVLVSSSESHANLKFALDYAFSASSAAAAVIVGNNYSGKANWKLPDGSTLGQYLDSLAASEQTAHAE